MTSTPAYCRGCWYRLRIVEDGCSTAVPLLPTMMELRVEVQLRSILELYGSIVGAGLELTRSSHRSLTDLVHLSQKSTSTADLRAGRYPEVEDQFFGRDHTVFFASSPAVRQRRKKRRRSIAQNLYSSPEAGHRPESSSCPSRPRPCAIEDALITLATCGT